MDEQDVARDRSVSPNYHSLIYGDTKRKESKQDSFSNGSNKESRPDHQDGATLSEAATL